jgi:hypothetical protein
VQRQHVTERDVGGSRRPETNLSAPRSAIPFIEPSSGALFEDVHYGVFDITVEPWAPQTQRAI